MFQSLLKVVLEWVEREPKHLRLRGYDWSTRDNTVYVIATFQDIGDMFMNLVGNHKIQMDVSKIILSSQLLTTLYSTIPRKLTCPLKN